jgi:hypothetical protein
MMDLEHLRPSAHKVMAPEDLSLSTMQTLIEFYRDEREFLPFDHHAVASIQIMGEMLIINVPVNEASRVEYNTLGYRRDKNTFYFWAWLDPENCFVAEWAKPILNDGGTFLKGWMPLVP